jgi:hypothetical protein
MSDTISAKYYVALLGKLMRHSVSKLRDKLSKWIFFHQDNAAPYKAATTHQKLAYLHFDVLKHWAHTPELALPDHDLSLILKKQLKRKKVFEHWVDHISY